MARERSPARDKAKEMYLNAKGDIKLKNIAEKLGVLDTQIRKWKSTDKWDDELKGTLPIEKGNVTNESVPNRNEISWIDIENEYVTDIRKKPCTYENLANKYNVSFSRIEKYARENNWQSKREDYAKTVREKSKEKTSELISTDIAKYTAKHLAISDKLLNSIEEAMKNENQMFLHTEVLRTGYGAGEFKDEIAEEVLNSINDKKLANVVSSLEKLQKMQRQTLGILDEKDRKKFELEENKNKEDSTDSDIWSEAVEELFKPGENDG